MDYLPDKPQGRKSRAGMGTAVPCAGAMGISESRRVKSVVGVIIGECPLGEIAVAERAEAMSKLRLHRRGCELARDSGYWPRRPATVRQRAAGRERYWGTVAGRRCS